MKAWSLGLVTLSAVLAVGLAACGNESESGDQQHSGGAAGEVSSGAIASDGSGGAQASTGSGGMILAESFAWDEIDGLGERLVQVIDRNLGTAAQAQQRGEAYLRKAGIAAGGGSILVPVNCGQQLYDVVAITDARAGLDASPRRVAGISLHYNPGRGEYRQRLYLGAV